ncbi:hypothetical protein HNQ50_000469 [Silvimonas terrae]|uniref:Uncharacterized protein n=2 Tax=Silvimonas terrae TaxID=300266 RepID=A0A840R8S5_9NEIS|nr:hypothetical protein [Silvimonas terrae]
MRAESWLEFQLPPDSPVIAAYNNYMARLPAATSDASLETLMLAHRVPFFRYRRLLADPVNRRLLLGALTPALPAAQYQATPAATDASHPEKPDKQWQPATASDMEQATQLVAEQKRLENYVNWLRSPWQRGPGAQADRYTLTDYDRLLLTTWDDTTPFSSEQTQLLAQHVHDSVAAFTNWPCALYEQRGVFSDRLHTDARNDRWPARDNKTTAMA